MLHVEVSPFLLMYVGCGSPRAGRAAQPLQYTGLSEPVYSSLAGNIFSRNSPLYLVEIKEMRIAVSGSVLILLRVPHCTGQGRGGPLFPVRGPGGTNAVS